MSATYQITRLTNGFTVSTASMPQMASVCVGLWVAVGSRHEPAELNGAAHFIEHMLFKGTRGRSARQISEAVEGIGGYLNAFTTEESTAIYAKAGAARFDDLLDVLMDMFLHSRFDARELAKERGVIKEELAMYLDEPHQHVQELLSETMWPDHPLGRPLTGTEASLDRLGRAQLLGYYRRNYVAPGVLLIAAGNVRHEQLLRAARRFARELPDGQRASFVPVQTEQREPRVRLCTRAVTQTQMDLGIRVCSRHDERRYALRLLNALLGESMSSRLFQVVREDHGLVYSIHSSLNFLDDVGALTISAGLDTDELPRVLKLIGRELRRLTATPPSVAELRRARDYLIGQMDLALEGTENQMMWQGDQLIGFGRVIPPAETRRRLAGVSAGQVSAVARDFFRAERFSLALVSPLKTDRGLVRALRL